MKHKGFILPDPTGYRLLVEVEGRFVMDENEDGAVAKTQGGIYIPMESAAKEAGGACVGTVIAMGPDCYNDQFDNRHGMKRPYAKVGDVVFLLSHSGTIVPNYGQKFAWGKYQFVPDTQIQGVYPKEEYNELLEKSRG